MDILVFNWLDRRNPRAGGAEVHLHEVFGRLASKGHRVTLVTSGWRGALARETVDGMDVHRVGGRETFFVLAARYYQRHLAHRRYDVMVEDLNKAPLFTNRWGQSPVVLLVHHLFGGTAFLSASPPVAVATWMLERAVGFAYRHVSVIAVSESTAEELARLGIPPERIAVVHNGVDDRLLGPVPLAIPDPDPTVLYLGRLERYKRVDLLIRAIGRLRDAGEGVRLVIAGDGRHAAALRRLVHRLSVADRVTFTGRVPDAAKQSLMQRAWIHAITSRKEGWGITVLEAAASGTPSIASDSPGLCDAVVHGETGVLVRHGDVTALADSIRALVNDRERLARLSRAARERAERFTWDAAAAAVEAHLRATAAGEPPALAGAWAHYRRVPSLSTVALPRTGPRVAPFGSASWVVEALGSRGGAIVRVTVGARDRNGGQVIATIRVLQAHTHADALGSPTGTRRDHLPESIAPLELPGWPVDPERFLRDVLARVVGTPLVLTAVRRVAEPPLAVPRRTAV